MATISILLILSFTLCFIFTRDSIIRLRKEEGLRVEIHLQLIAFVINPQKKEKPSEKGKSETKKIVLKAVRQLLKRSQVRLTRLAIPCPREDASVTGLARYRILSAAAISYVETLSNQFILCDNAIILSPDLSSIQYDVSIKCRLYQIVYTLIKLGLHKFKEKINVRE